MGAVDALVLWLHIVGAAIWVGGIIFLGAVLQPLSRTLILDPIERSKFMGRVGSQFIRLGWAGLTLLVLTGLYNIQRVSGRFDNVGHLLLTTKYGLILDTKLVFVLGMILLTAHHRGTPESLLAVAVRVQAASGVYSKPLN